MENRESISYANTGVVDAGKIPSDVNIVYQYFDVTPTLLSPISFQVIFPDPNFTGREKELRTLDAYCEKPPHIVVVYGLGGIGKTSLVRKYVANEKFQSQNVIWINAIQQESMEADFESLATNALDIRTLDMDGRKKNFLSILNEVMRKLCTIPTLIVLDSVELVQKFAMESVLRILPSGDYRPHFIITSRIGSWNRNSVSVMPIRDLNDSEAIELVTKLLTNTLKDEESSHSDSPNEIKKLVTILQNFPLAIRQATAHINYQRQISLFSITNYIGEYNSYKQQYLSSQFFQEEIFFAYEKTTFTTWRITIDEIAKNQSVGELALRILRIIAYFEADHISRNIFFHLTHPSSNDRTQEVDIVSAVRLLVSYSMIEGREQQSILSVHRLVQSVMKIDMENVAGISCTALRDGLNILNKVLARQHFKDAKENVEHGMSVFLSALTVEDLVKEFSFFPSVVLRKANECGRYRQCVSFGYNILPRLTEILGENDLNTINAKSEVANAYSKMGKYAEALQMQQEIYEKQVEILSADHPDTFKTKSKIASLYSEMGKYADGLQMFRENYQKQVEILGADHPSTIMTQSNMANSYFKSGKYAETLHLLENIMENRVKILGEFHPDIIKTKSNMANSYSHLGKHDEALQMRQEVYQKSVEIFGADHPDTITANHNLANSYSKMGKHAEALQMRQEIYQKRMEIFGADHPDTITAKSNIASSFSEMGQHAKALQMHQEVYQRFEEILGLDHPETITAKSNIAISYSKMGKHAEALQILQDVYQKQLKVLGPDHPHTVTTHSNITEVYSEKGDDKKNCVCQ